MNPKCVCIEKSTNDRSIDKRQNRIIAPCLKESKNRSLHKIMHMYGHDFINAQHIEVINTKFGYTIKSNNNCNHNEGLTSYEFLCSRGTSPSYNNSNVCYINI